MMSNLSKLSLETRPHVHRMKAMKGLRYHHYWIDDDGTVAAAAAAAAAASGAGDADGKEVAPIAALEESACSASWNDGQYRP